MFNRISTFPTTPTTVRHGASSYARIRRPTALAPGQRRDARAALMTATSPGSRRANVRPSTNGIFSTSKNCGVTTRPPDIRSGSARRMGVSSPSTVPKLRSCSIGGSPSAIATPDTPGNRDTALDNESKNSWRAAAVGYRSDGRLIDAASTSLGSKPGSSAFSCTNVRTISAEPTSSTIENATSASTSPPDIRPDE